MGCFLLEALAETGRRRRARRLRCADALGRAVVAVQRQAERVAGGIDVHPRDLDRVAHQGALDLLGAVVLVRVMSSVTTQSRSETVRTRAVGSSP
jgi:hypothetical protein